MARPTAAWLAFKHLIDTRLTSQRSRNVLTHRGAERLKFRDTHKLNSGVWDRLNARIGRVGALQRPERSSGEGGLLVFRVVVSRLSCPGRNSRPADVVSDQLDIVL